MKKIAIIGASHAGISCAEKLRRYGFDGRITLIDRIPGLPVQRPPLSKDFLKYKNVELQGFYLRQKEYYEKEKIELITGKDVFAVNRESNSIIFESGSEINYDVLILATGADAKIPPYIRKDISNIYVLRNNEDAVRLKEGALIANKAVIVGGGFIGLEVASSLRSIGLSVDLIEFAPRLLSRVSSQYISDYLQLVHQKEGVSIHLSESIEEIIYSKFNKVEAVKLCSGKILRCDVLIYGIGVSPNVKLANDLGLSVTDGVKVDSSYLAGKNIYAIGDVAYSSGEINSRIESVFHAQFSATVAAASITNSPLPSQPVFWFWSDQYDLKLQIAGILPKPIKEEFLRGEVREGKKEGSFSVWNWYQNKLVCVEALEDSQAYMVGKRLIEQNITISPAIIKDRSVDLKEMLKNLL